MNDAHLHLIFNHLPIVAAIIGLVIFISGFILRSELVKRVAYFVFVLAALTTLPSMYTGEGAEEVVESLPYATEQLIHQHEEEAELFAVLSYILGGLSLFAAYSNWKRRASARITSYTLFILAVIVVIQGTKVGTTGGEIRHTEIRKNQQTETRQIPEMDEDDD